MDLRESYQKRKYLFLVPHTMQQQPKFPVFSKLLMQDKYKFITHFLKLFDTTEDKDKRALQGIVAILTYEEKFDPCFSYLLQNEVNTRDLNTGILRGSTPCTRLITEYLRMHQSFLNSFFSKILLKVLKRDNCSEINPHLTDDPTCVKKRTKKLLMSAEKVFKGLMKSPIPSSISNLCIVLARTLQETGVELPETQIPTGDDKYAYFAVSNTIFLHFICPFLANPPEELLAHKNARRTLVMFAKLFQALANACTFDVDWMAGCNNFLIQMRPQYEKFCDVILNPKVECDLFSLPNRISSGSSVNLMNRWKAIYRWIKSNQERILEEIDEEDRAEYEKQLNSTHLEVAGKRRESFSCTARKISEPQLRSQVSPQVRQRRSCRHQSSELATRKGSRNGLYHV